MIVKDIDAFLEHHGVRGQKWGVRRAQRHSPGRIESSIHRQIRRARKSTQKMSPNQKKALVATAALGATFIAGHFSGRRGHISIQDANNLVNQKSGKLVRDIGHQFVTDSIDKQVILNFGRQIKEGLVNL